MCGLYICKCTHTLLTDTHHFLSPLVTCIATQRVHFGTYPHAVLGSCRRAAIAPRTASVAGVCTVWSVPRLYKGVQACSRCVYVWPLWFSVPRPFGVATDASGEGAGGGLQEQPPDIWVAAPSPHLELAYRLLCVRGC